MNDKTMLSTEEAADYLGVKLRSFAQNWHRWGVTAYQVGRNNRFRVSDLEQFLDDHRATEPRRP